MNKEKLKELYDKKEQAYNEWRKIEGEYFSMLNSDFDFIKGKYLYFESSNLYMYVSSFFIDQRDRDVELIINGKAFQYSDSEYEDDCYFQSDMMFQHTVKLSKYSSKTIVEQFNAIYKIIDKDIFIETYNKVISKYSEDFKID